MIFAVLGKSDSRENPPVLQLEGEKYARRCRQRLRYTDRKISTVSEVRVHCLSDRNVHVINKLGQCYLCIEKKTHKNVKHILIHLPSDVSGGSYLLYSRLTVKSQ